MPLELQEKGGWESREVVNAYAKYAKVCFELFGHKVKRWLTFNEPIVPVEGGYLYDFDYPNVVDFNRAVQVAYSTMIANAKAIEVFRSLNIKDAKIGIVLNLTPSYPRSNNPADLFFNRSFLDPAVKGEYPEELKEVIKKEGCNVKGYHMWTFIDNWSWSNAYKNRYGFIQLDLKTQKRIIKKSGYWIKEVSKNNGF